MYLAPNLDHFNSYYVIHRGHCIGRVGMVFNTTTWQAYDSRSFLVGTPKKDRYSAGYDLISLVEKGVVLIES